jgi:hypothetical protein
VEASVNRSEHQSCVKSSRHESQPSHPLFFQQLSGCKGQNFSELLLAQGIAACETIAPDMNPGRAILEALEAMKPEDPVEAALIVQMLTGHHRAMEMMAKAGRPGSQEVQDKYLHLAVRLLSLYTRQIEAFARYRRKGIQKVEVQHLTVESGAQAIVGQVMKA